MRHPDFRCSRDFRGSPRDSQRPPVCYSRSLFILFNFRVRTDPPLRSCSQNRITVQSFRFNSRVTCLSRRSFRSIFLTQYSVFVAGIRQCFGHLCQKQPSMNTAMRPEGKTKSGLPVSEYPRRQPVIWRSLRIRMNFCSVDLLPEDLTLAMIRERSLLEKVSIMRNLIRLVFSIHCCANLSRETIAQEPIALPPREGYSPPVSAFDCNCTRF